VAKTIDYMGNLRGVILIVGGVAEFSRLLGISPQAVSQWKSHAPDGRIGRICSIVDGKVEPFELHPSFPVPSRLRKRKPRPSH